MYITIIVLKIENCVNKNFYYCSCVIAPLSTCYCPIINVHCLYYNVTMGPVIKSSIKKSTSNSTSLKKSINNNNDNITSSNNNLTSSSTSNISSTTSTISSVIKEIEPEVRKI